MQLPNLQVQRESQRLKPAVAALGLADVGFPYRYLLHHTQPTEKRTNLARIRFKNINDNNLINSLAVFAGR